MGSRPLNNRSPIKIWKNIFFNDKIIIIIYDEIERLNYAPFIFSLFLNVIYKTNFVILLFYFIISIK